MPNILPSWFYQCLTLCTTLGPFQHPPGAKIAIFAPNSPLDKGRTVLSFLNWLKTSPRVLPAHNNCKIYQFWVKLACKSGVYQVIQAPEVPFMGNQKQALLLKVHIFRHRKMEFPVPKQKNKTTFAPQLSPIMVDLTSVLSLCRFWGGFQPIQNMQNNPSPGKRADLAKIAISAPGRC